ncbi:MAG TPA: alkaline phosphatase family protein [bacterium]|nr:alkaline phosphatase family protein [bacterium]
MSKKLRINSLKYTAVFLVFLSCPALAYIGPGAGFAFMSSFLVVFASIFIAILILLTAPVRILIKALKGKRKPSGIADRVIVVGLDGLDPGLVSSMIGEGELPNFRRLKDEGGFSPLATTCPPISPVAWSSFMTGVSPAKHNIYDFLTPERKTYFPVLSSSEIKPSEKFIRIGQYRIPVGKPSLRLLRKGKPFWKVLGENGIFSTVIRVPITFPPEKFSGHLLSAMCVPDVKGTQGTFAFYTSVDYDAEIYEGGERFKVEVENRSVAGRLTGPANTVKEGAGAASIPFRISWKEDEKAILLRIQDQKIKLELNEYSEWVQLKFRMGPRAVVYGICRFYLKSVEPDFELYVSPVNIDPENPALPISNPVNYSIYMSKMIGSYATLGLAEDTWALNERIIDEEAFLKQCYLNHREREKMLFLALDRTKKGACVCVFDSTDRIQHMFWRYHERCEHQVLDGYDVYKDAVRNIYRESDRLVGRVMERMKKKDVLIVMSDHGFKSFRRGVDVNAWLEKNGYLFRRKDAVGGSWLRDVDWSRTKAYALGLAGIYLNIKGREKQGIVEPAEAASLRSEIAGKLGGLVDEETGETAVLEGYDLYGVMKGPYLENGPDVIVGYNKGYRASWDCAVGKLSGKLFENNTKSWSGDHCVDPRLVPGCFFCSTGINGNRPGMVDIAPSIMDLLGVKPPEYIEGRSLFSGN